MYTRVLLICYSLKDDLKESSDADSWDIGLNDKGTNYDIDKDGVEDFGETDNYIHKSVDKPGPHFSMEATVFNSTSPARYPRGGTGTTVKIAYRFEPTVFNSFCKSSPDLLAIIPIYSRPDAVLKVMDFKKTSCNGAVCISTISVISIYIYIYISLFSP